MEIISQTGRSTYAPMKHKFNLNIEVDFMIMYHFSVLSAKKVSSRSLEISRKFSSQGIRLVTTIQQNESFLNEVKQPGVNVKEIAPRTCKVIQDSLGFWIPGCGFRFPGSGFRISCRSVELGHGFPISILCQWNFLDSRF